MATEQKNESSEEWAEIDITPSEDKEADVAFEIEEEPVEEEAVPTEEETPSEEDPSEIPSETDSE